MNFLILKFVIFLHGRKGNYPDKKHLSKITPPVSYFLGHLQEYEFEASMRISSPTFWGRKDFPILLRFRTNRVVKDIPYQQQTTTYRLAY